MRTQAPTRPAHTMRHALQASAVPPPSLPPRPPSPDEFTVSPATSTDTSKSEMRTQAKTGIAFAVLICVGAIVGGYFWHRHRKHAREREYAVMERVTEMH